MKNAINLPNMGGNTLSASISSKLLTEMRSGIYAECERLPSEVELAEHFRVSRTVVRDVLSTLEREGFIERGRGVGTTIHREIVNMTNRLDLKYEYYDLVRSTGRKPSTDRVKLSELPATQKIAEIFDLAVGEPFIFCEKRILADSVPVIYSHDYIPKNIFGKKNYKNLDWSLPVFDLLEANCNITIDTDLAKVSAVNPGEPVSDYLQLEDGEAVMFFHEIGYYKLTRPILYSENYFRNFASFTLLRKKF